MLNIKKIHKIKRTKLLLMIALFDADTVIVTLPFETKRPVK